MDSAAGVRGGDRRRASLPAVFARYRDTAGEAPTVSRGPALVVAAGVLLGALLIWFAAYRGMAHWQSIPSTWDAVWHANEIRWILDTAQASSTHMGELRNVETHMQLYYPSTFHALGAVLSQLTGAAPTTAYTLSSLAAAAWLFPVSAAMLTWNLLRPDPGSPVPSRDRSAHSRVAPAGRHDGRRAVGVVHRGALRRVRRGRDTQPGGVRPGRPDDGADHVLPAPPRPDSAGDPGPAGRVLHAHHRRRGRGDVRGGVVAVRRPVASGARQADRLRDPADRRRADAAGSAAAVPRGAAAGRDHRRARVRHPSRARSGRCSTRSCSTPGTSTTIRSRTS